MNNIYEFGGTADLLLRFKTEEEVDGVHYAANEPYTFLKDVTIQWNYDQSMKESSGKKTVFSAHDGRPKQLIVSGVSLTQKIAHLIMTSSEDKTYIRTRRERVVCNSEEYLKLNYVPNTNSVFIYNVEGNRIDIQSMNNNIVYGAFNYNEEYLVFYTQQTTGDKYTLEIPYYPYFALDIFMKGNTNKISNDIYMHFDAASLVAVPNLNIMSGGILHTPLVFDIIYARQEEPIVAFE